MRDDRFNKWLCGVSISPRMTFVFHLTAVAVSSRPIAVAPAVSQQLFYRPQHQLIEKIFWLPFNFRFLNWSLQLEMKVTWAGIICSLYKVARGLKLCLFRFFTHFSQVSSPRYSFSCFPTDSWALSYWQLGARADFELLGGPGWAELLDGSKTGSIGSSCRSILIIC